MTTANLSVGIKTESARQSLLDLKRWMKQEMAGALSVDGANLTKSVQSELSKLKVKINVDTEALKAEVGGALKSAFSTTHRVNIDAVALAAQVRAAVSNGLSGAGGVAVAGGASGAAPAAVTAALVPAIDRMVKSIEDAVQARAPRGTGPGRSVVGPTRETLNRLRDAESRDLDRAVNSQADANRTFRFRQNWLKNNDDPGWMFGPNRGDMLRLQGQDQLRQGRMRAQSAGRIEVETLLGLPSRDETKAISARIAAQFRDGVQAEALRAQSASRIDVETLLGLPSRDETKAMSARLAAQFREGAQTEALRAKSASRIEAETLLGLPSRDETKSMSARIAAQIRDGVRTEALRAKSASGVDARTLLGLPSAGEMSSFTAQIKAQMREAVGAARLEMQRFFQDAKFNAASRFKGKGADIAAAQALAGRFGAGPAADFLGPRAGLLERVADLDRYKAKATEVVGSHRLLRDSIQDVHSAARGFAGSMGGMWLTWGNTVPLVAFAALGMALRSTFTVGKELEHQLAFVKVLSDGTAVSLTEFGNAVRGSLVAPVEAAQALRALAQNGLNAQEALAALPAILTLATAGEMSLSEAALGATGVMAAFNLQVSDLSRIGDVFAKAAAVSNTNVTSMVEAMKQASTVSDQYKVSLEETAASLAVMAKRNIEGSAAGTAFRNMMTELATPTKKAQEAMASLGLELYDENNQLKGFTTILGDLKEKTASLNEKGRLTFLREIFDERGAKAANALLSDFDLFGKTLDTLKNKSEGFTQSVNDALAQTTEGKIKRLVSEFQLSTSAAFSDVSIQVGNFIDQLRVAASSNEFREFLKTITEGVISLSRFFVEHHKVIGLTALAWVTLRGAMVAIEMWSAARTAIAGVTTGLMGLRAAALATAGALTGGLALIVALGAEYLLLRSRTDEATESQLAFDNQIKLQSKTLDDSVAKLKAENEQLSRRVQLQKQGYSGDQAKKMVEDNAVSKEKTDARDTAKANLDKALANLEKVRLARDAVMPAPGAETVLANQTVLAAEREVMQRRQTLKNDEANYTLWQEEQAQKRVKATETEVSERLNLMKEFNKQLHDFRRRNPSKEKNLEGLFITQGEALTGDKGDFDTLLSQRKAKLNSQGDSFKPKDHKAEAAARREQLALSRQVIDSIRQEESAAKQAIKFARELNDARFNAAQFGPFVAAKAAEMGATREMASLLALEQNAVTKLRAEKAKLSDAADKANIDTEIQRRLASIDLLKREVGQRKDLLAIKAQEQARQGVAEEARLLRGLADKDGEQVSRLQVKYDTKTMSGADAAQREAELQVEERYRESITSKELRLSELRSGLAALQERINDATADQRQELEELYVQAEKNLEVENARLGVVTMQALKAREANGQAARTEFDKSQTAEYGWQRFWKEYVEQGLSSAAIVYEGMKSATRGMSDALANFIVTGKGGFRGLVSTVLAELARMMAAKAMQQLIMLGMGLLTAGAGAGMGINGSAGTGFGSSITLPGGTAFAANGHVMTQYGPMALRKYADGGIARRPQLAVFGEGSRPEAYVPLPDGRTIPVTMKGDAGGGGVINNVNVSVNLHQDGRAEVSSDTDAREAGELGRKINDAILAVIVREKRPGGLLY